MRVLIVALVLVCVVGGGAAVPAEQQGIEIEPDSPTSHDPIVVTVTHVVPDTCWQLVRSQVDVNWKKRKVKIALKYVQLSGGCLAIAVEKVQPVNVPPLAPGEWDVRIKVKRGKKKVIDATCPLTVGLPF